MVELLIVIVVLGVLATVTVFAVRGITDSAEENSEAAELRVLETANERYWIEFGANATEQDLLDNGYITELPTMFDLAVDGAGVLTITNTRTGGVARTSSADGGGGGGSAAASGAVGTLEGLVKNASTDTGMAGVLVCVRTTSDCVTTDGTGAYAIADVPTGEQTIDFTATGFTAFAETATIAEGVATTQNTAMSLQLAAGDVRIVLTWGENPQDLDSFLSVPGGSQISWRGKGSLVSAPFAQLDVDDVDGFGPETITISQLSSGTYAFAVQLLGTVVPEETTVRVYDSGGLLGEFVPPAGSDSWWRVFTLDGDTGLVTAVNTINSTSGQD